MTSHLTLSPARFGATAALLALSALVPGFSSEAHAQQAPPKLPAEFTLAKPLGFRTVLGLGDNLPFVFPDRKYLQPPTRVKLLTSLGVLFSPNVFCRAEVDGKQGWIRCDDATAFIAAPPAPAPKTTMVTITPPSVTKRPVVVSSTPSGGQRCVTDTQYMNYKQAADAWKDKPVHPGYMTFGRTGCHLVSWTMALGYWGYTYNPIQLRDALDQFEARGINAWEDGKDRKIYATETIVTALTKTSKRTKLRRTSAPGGKHNAELLELVRQHFCVQKQGEPMIGGVDYEKDKNDTEDHLVVIIGYEDGQPIVLDPGSNDNPTNREGKSKSALPENNGPTKTGVLLGDINRPKQGRYALSSLEFVQ